MDEPRYYVRATTKAGGWGHGKPPIVCFVRDRWYCCRDVATYCATDERYAGYSPSHRRKRVRQDAERYCETLNAEHEADIEQARPLSVGRRAAS